MKSVFSNRKKRSSEEIIASMLFTAKGGVSKTGIMYTSYLSFSQLKKYVNFGIKAKLIYTDERGKYFTTPKGMEYLKCFDEVRSMENDAFEKRKRLDEILNE